MDAYRWSPDERSRLYRRQAGRARRAEVEAALPPILDGPADRDWGFLTLEEGDPLSHDLRGIWTDQRTTDAHRRLPVERAALEPTVARHVARLAGGERVLVFLHDVDLVGLLELSAMASRAATRLVELDGEVIAATTFDGRWGLAIDLQRDDDSERFEIDAWEATPPSASVDL